MRHYNAFVAGEDVGDTAELTWTGGVIVERDEDYPGVGYWITEIEIGSTYRMCSIYLDLEDERFDWDHIEQKKGVTQDESDREYLAYSVYKYCLVEFPLNGDGLKWDILTFEDRLELSQHMINVGFGSLI